MRVLGNGKRIFVYFQAYSGRRCVSFEFASGGCGAIVGTGFCVGINIGANRAAAALRICHPLSGREEDV